MRVSVVGNTGSGKSTLARALADRLGVPHVELDAIRHQPDWEEMPDHRFLEEVERATRGPGWVVDGNYSEVTIRGPVWDRADTVVWIDLPRRTVMRQLAARTLSRVITRRELWNGNREPFSNLWSLDPERSVLAWSWTRHRAYRERYMAEIASPEWSHLRFVRLTSRPGMRAWLAAVPPGGPVVPGPAAAR
jgi:adenylate kinase family enzyme